MKSKKSWERTNNRKESGGFFALPASVLASSNFIRLTAKGVKLLVDMGAQYKGSNNGDLCATWSMMEKRGWKSRSTLHEALNELLHYGFIIKTKQGGQHAPSLYAITWKKIDECGGKLEIKPTTAPLALWISEKQPYIKASSNKYRNSI